MVEVPDYLLERSKERRAALSGEAPAEDTSGAEPSASSAPSAGAADAGAGAAAGKKAAEAAVPAAGKVPVAIPAGPPPPPEAPIPEVVALAKRRRKIPYWVMPVLLFLPIWAFIYVGTLEEPAQSAEGLFADGSEAYIKIAACAVCHTASGAGSSAGPPLAAAEQLATFPDDDEGLGIAQQIEWVIKGTNGVGVGNPYGSPEQGRVGGWFGNMPGFGDQLTPYELVAVVIHERAVLADSETSRTQGLLLEEALNSGALTLPESWSSDTTAAEINGILSGALSGAENS